VRSLQSAPELDAGRPTGAVVGPSTVHKVVNYIVFQGVWWIAVTAAARGWPSVGLAAIAAAVGWHLWMARRADREAVLIVAVTAIGFGFELLRLLGGDMRYASGQPVAWLPPFWLVGMWSLLAITLNVSLRWQHRRPWLAALFGMIGGPAAFWAGVRLDGATFVDATSALIWLAIGWALLMPVLVRLARSFDGIAGQA